MSGDLIERKLDPAANKKISHSTDYFLYISECISMDMVAEVDKLDINEHYSQALKACYNLSASLSSSSCLSIFFMSSFFRRRRPSTSATVFEISTIPQLHKQMSRN